MMPRNPSIEISSSNNGQCIPYPEGDISNEYRSSSDAFSRMGDTSFRGNFFSSLSKDVGSKTF